MVDPAVLALRQAAADRLAVLDQHGDLTSHHVRLAAQTVGVSERTAWRWVAARRAAEPMWRKRERFRIDHRLRIRFAYWRGNAAALHRELVEQAEQGGAPAPSLVTVQRALRKDVSRGDRAGLRAGELERRKFDVFLKRPSTYRNAEWEADHVEASVEVDVGDRLAKPWVTWFVDRQYCLIMGVAVTPRFPNREAILASLRASILTEEPYGPAGGLPTVVRMDQGKDFLSSTVQDALGVFGTRVVVLPGYTPYLKGAVETVNGAVKRMLFKGMPRYTHSQTGVNGAVADPDAPALPFEAFVADLLDWVRTWNNSTDHDIDRLNGVSPLDSWLADPTPLQELDRDRLWMFTLEDDRKPRVISTKGVARGKGRHYIADWMVGLVGAKVRVRYMPNHHHEIEVFDAQTGRHLGPAILADQAPPQMIRDVQRARAGRARQLRADLAAAERSRRIRYAAVTRAEPAQPLDMMTVERAKQELGARSDSELAKLARPLVIPLSHPPPEWVRPIEPSPKRELKKDKP
ncbi:Mu transposase C-terminal domain-containing protein [Nocardia sp. FBN12]|uniref:Mu transposase C-terminal domain-containing protein n=1 Tax=unclassified Nocardia TaxID=2637762 RepID=UPI003640C07E